MGTFIGVIWVIAGAAGIIDAVMHPADWAEADRNKPFWIVMMFFFGVLGTVAYLTAVRPRFAGADNPFRK